MFIGFIILSNIFYNSAYVYSSELNIWEKVYANNEVIRYIDINSIKYKGIILQLLAKETEIVPETNQVINNKIFKMEIDCDKRIYREGSQKWTNPSNKIMKETIISSCQY